MYAELVDGGGVDGDPSRKRRAEIRDGGGRGEVLGEMVEDGCESVVFVQTGESAGSQLVVKYTCQLIIDTYTYTIHIHSRGNTSGLLNDRIQDRGYIMATHLQRWFQSPRKLRQNHTHLFPYGYVRLPHLDQYPSTLDQLRHAFPIEFKPRFVFEAFNTGGTSEQLRRPSLFFILPYRLPIEFQTLHERLSFTSIILLKPKSE